MSLRRSRSFGRGVVAVCAAGALLVSLLASPASATSAPNDTSIMGLLKGGQIVWHQDGDDVVFPLGEKEGSSLKEKTGDSVCDPELNEKKEALRSFFTADVDSAGHADNFAFHFAQGSTGQKWTIFTQQYEVCAQLEVTNPGQVEGSVSGKAVTLNPGPALSTNLVIKTKPQGQVAWVCRSETSQDTHTGAFSEPKEYEEKQAHDWNLTHEPDTQPLFVAAVQSTTECPSFIASELNASYGLPTTGEAGFKWAVYDCDVKECNGDPDPWLGPPNDTSIDALLKGGELALGEDKQNPDWVLPLGEKDGSTGSGVCAKNEDRSNVTADVDATGGVDDFDFHFAQWSTGIKGSLFGTPYEVCVALTVTNGPAMAAQITNNDIQMSPGPQFDMTFRTKNQNNGSVMFTCVTDADAGDLGGLFSEPKAYDGKDPGDWNVDLFNKDKFFVAEVVPTGTFGSCPSLIADSLNNSFGLPNWGNLHLKYLGYNV